jgi:hypothetical protein
MLLKNRPSTAAHQAVRIETPTEREVRLGSRLQGPFIGEDKSATEFTSLDFHGT